MIELEDKKLLEMPIDQFGRYYLASLIIKKFSLTKKEVKIIDIGGYNGSLHNFLNEEKYKITVLDVYDSKAVNYVKGNALAIPFSDNEFDFAVSFEVFEHIPRADRSTYIKEAVRVSKGPFIMSAPFNNKDNKVLSSEKLLNGLWKYIHKKEHIWLKEHIQYITPTPIELEKIIKFLRVPFSKFGNNDLLLWNLLQSIAFLTTIYKPSGQHPAIHEFYNRHFDIIESEADEFYRYIYVIGCEISLNDIYKVQERKNKQTVTYELINQSFLTLAKDIKELKKERDKLVQERNKNKELTQELQYKQLEIEQIKTSSAWKLANKITAAGRKIPGGKKVGKWIR